MTERSTIFYCFGPHLEKIRQSGSPRLEEGDKLIPTEAAFTIARSEKAEILVTPPWLWIEPNEPGNRKEERLPKTENWGSFARWCLQMSSLKEVTLRVLPSCGEGHNFEALLRAYLHLTEPTSISLWNRLLLVANHSLEDWVSFNVWNWLSNLQAEQKRNAESVENALKQALDIQNEVARTKQELDKSSQALSEAQAESDLLLAQLHQVQEELERYYLLTKDYEQHSMRAAQALKAARLQIQKNWIAAGLQLN